jgi:hypothetical protein
MRTIALSAMLLVLANASLAAESQPRELIAKQLPNGEIEGWKSFHQGGATKTGDVWKLQADGVLVCKGNPLGYLYTEKTYTDVSMELEWRWPPEGKPGNGGLLLRVAGEHKIWPKSLEVQLNNGQAGDFWGLGGYSLVGPADRMESMDNTEFGKLTHVKFTKKLERPAGQWNQCKVQLKGGVIRVEINGEPANAANHCEALAGPIVLTSEGSEIQFRNVRLLSE